MSLPQDERLFSVQRVAKLEAQDRDLRERAVVGDKGGVCLRYVLQGHVYLAGLHVVQDRVALGEGAPLGVLTRQAYRHAVLKQRGEGQRLGVRPVYAIAEVGPVPLEEPLELIVSVEAFGTFEEGFVEGL